MSSLFDDSFLADLKPSRAHEEEPPPHEDEPPPPPEDEAPESGPVPDDLFGGHFDVPPSRDGYYRDGAPGRTWTRPRSWTG